MKPRSPSRGAGAGGRNHLRLLAGAEARSQSAPEIEANRPEDPGFEDGAREDEAREDEDLLEPGLTPEPDWADDREAFADPGVRPAGEPRVSERVPRSVEMAALSALPDAQLVSVALGGEARAFEILYRRHVSFAIHLATRIEGSSRDVEDIVHDAFIKAFSRLRDLADPAAFRSWLGSIVVFAVRSRLRRTRLMNLLGLGRGSDPIDLDSLASSDASPQTRAQLAQIYALLRTRPTDERIAWTLRCVEGHELEVVARLTSCSLATVKRRIGRTQDFLDEHFVTEAPEPSAGHSSGGHTGQAVSARSSASPAVATGGGARRSSGAGPSPAVTPIPVVASSAVSPDTRTSAANHPSARKSRP